MLLDLTGDKSTLLQIMAWYHQAPSHCFSHCQPFYSKYDFIFICCFLKLYIIDLFWGESTSCSIPRHHPLMLYLDIGVMSGLTEFEMTHLKLSYCRLWFYSVVKYFSRTFVLPVVLCQWYCFHLTIYHKQIVFQVNCNICLKFSSPV